jgi:hypothetical protein
MGIGMALIADSSNIDNIKTALNFTFLPYMKISN